jgi:3',5'-cyclic AMP phosphodiesterase CpdA
MKPHIVASAALTAVIMGACAALPRIIVADRPLPRPPARFAVVSDPHLFDASGSSGPALERAFSGDMKLFAESAEILDEALNGVIAAAPDFMIVPGDLTKDGEKDSHRLMARMLERIERAGIPVFVVPGNHDILNPHAVKLVGDKAEKTDTITPGDFSAIYAPFGYGEALMRDAASLSYVAEPVQGLWVLGLDSCRYGEDAGAPVTDGRLRPATLRWLSEVLREAAARGKTVIAFMHHGAMEHFLHQDSYLGQYVMDDHHAVARMLAMGGVRTVFTGHGHAQDIAVERFEDGSFLFDVQTGSTASFPDPYRIVSVSADSRMRIESRRITEIPGMPEGFPAYAEKRLRQSLMGTATSILRRALVSEKSAGLIAGQAIKAAVAFYCGDEPGRSPPLDREGLDCWGGLAAAFLDAPLAWLGTDLMPVDNDILIDLTAGSWRPLGDSPAR